MSELIVVFLLCACGVIMVVSHARALAGSSAHHRELDRLLGAIERACADFLWQETRLLGLLLLAIGVVLCIPMAVWRAPAIDLGARIALSAMALLLGGAAGACVARATHWAASRATARALAALRDAPHAAGSAVFRGAALVALLTDGASLLLPWGCFVAHYEYLIWVPRLDQGAALLHAARVAPICALGATCAAIVFQIGGSSFQTAASVAGGGARARDRRIALDDEQNPALIAELVGHYVGGVVFRSSDLFAALVLANSTLIALAGAVFQADLLDAAQIQPNGAQPGAGSAPAGAALALIALPLLVRASGSLAAAISLGSVRFEVGLTPSRALGGAGASQALIGAAGLLGATAWLLGDPLYVAGFGAGVLGIASSLACQGLLLAPRTLGPLALTEPLSLPETAEPVTSMARALGLGLQRAWAPLLIAGACLGSAYVLGARAPVHHGGAYALVLAVAGMLGSGALHLCSSAFSNIGCSVRRIAALRRGHYDLAARGKAAELEQSSQAVGNWGDTQSILAGTAAALLGAVTLALSEAGLLDRGLLGKQLLGKQLLDGGPDTTSGHAAVLGVGHPIVIVGGILGLSSLSFYVGGVLKNSGRAASALDEELRSAEASGAATLAEDAPALPLGEPAARAVPSYRGSVQRAASSATEALLPLAAGALLAPMLIGLLLRLIYGPGGGSYATHGLMALAAIAVLTGGSAALAAQGALTALAGARRRPEAGDVPGVTAVSRLDAAREFVGHSVGPAALLGLKATVVSALAIAPLLFPSAV